jgi:ferric-dicitrate binding protein FerR (iron transport regulator)
LQEIAGVLEDTYGLKIHFKESALQQRKFTGALPSQDMHLFLDILAQSMDVQMIKNKDSVHITH